MIPSTAMTDAQRKLLFSQMEKENIDKVALVEPYLVEYYGNGSAKSIEDPLPTVTSRDRFAFIEPRVAIEGVEYRFDIFYRMLKPRELAAAMGFPKEYQFMGNQQDQVKQIGNAVAVNMARSLISSLIESQGRAL